MTTLPSAKSEGEETFWLHCRAHNLTPIREAKLIDGRHFRFDFYFPEKGGLAVEIEGSTRFGLSRHSRGDGFEQDCRKYNAAALAHIRVLRFTTAMVRSGEAIDAVRAALMKAGRKPNPRRAYYAKKYGLSNFSGADRKLLRAKVLDQLDACKDEASRRLLMGRSR